MNSAAARAKSIEDLYAQGPIRKGPIYCSPWCGGRCTIAAFTKATKDADELAKKCGPGWKPVVSENLGWHYSAASPSGRTKIHEYGKPGTTRSRSSPSYTAYIDGGRFTSEGKTPALALRAGIAYVRERRDELTRVLNDLGAI